MTAAELRERVVDAMVKRRSGGDMFYWDAADAVIALVLGEVLAKAGPYVTWVGVADIRALLPEKRNAG